MALTDLVSLKPLHHLHHLLVTSLGGLIMQLGSLHLSKDLLLKNPLGGSHLLLLSVQHRDVALGD